MLIRDMKEYIAGKYPGSEWAKKVKDMRDDEVLATYKRLIKTVGQKPVVAHSPPLHQVAVYTCEDCFAVFMSPDHTITTCRHCGGKVITEYKTTSIRKETKS